VNERTKSYLLVETILVTNPVSSLKIAFSDESSLVTNASS